MFKNLFLLFKNINLSINILGCLIIKYLYNFSFGMQFSRYIMQRTSLQMRLKDSNFNIFHPFQRNTDVISISLRFKLRSMRCAIFLNSNFALLVLIKCFCGNTIASLRYARCACFLTLDFAFARLR